jgi:dTDP-4-dehydrorhamnose reductase
MMVTIRKPTGIFNLGSARGLSKAEFAHTFLRLMGLNWRNAKAVSIDDVSFVKTYRPRDMRMHLSKFETELDVTLPDLNSEISVAIGEYNEQT